MFPARPSTRVPGRRGARRTPAMLAAILATALTACDTAPAMVYVPESPSEITLTVRASATEVDAGTPVVLHAERRTRGRWRQVSREGLPEEACWLTAPPPDHEPEVAANLRWVAAPPDGARFNVGLREDGAREVTFSAPGTFVLTATSSAWCGSRAGVSASPLTIVVRAPAR